MSWEIVGKKGKMGKKWKQLEVIKAVDCSEGRLLFPVGFCKFWF